LNREEEIINFNSKMKHQAIKIHLLPGFAASRKFHDLKADFNSFVWMARTVVRKLRQFGLPRFGSVWYINLRRDGCGFVNGGK